MPAFDTVEINNTFYRLPEVLTFAAWKPRAPRGFVYAVKASRFEQYENLVKASQDARIARSGLLSRHKRNREARRRFHAANVGASGSR